MKNYLVKTPRLLKALYSQCIWHINDNANSVYITFDDGPHPVITPYILDLLKQYQAKATFFCIGKNVKDYPEVYQRILAEGHGVGNHTHNHLNGWNTENIDYFKDLRLASKYIQSNVFRPPYGRITYSQAMGVQRLFPKMQIIMWDILSGDFDVNLSAEDCLLNVQSTTQPGSIIVFHDSDKAWGRLEFALPKFLAYCQQKGWNMKRLKF